MRQHLWNGLLAVFSGINPLPPRQARRVGRHTMANVTTFSRYCCTSRTRKKWTGTDTATTTPMHTRTLAHTGRPHRKNASSAREAVSVQSESVGGARGAPSLSDEGGDDPALFVERRFR